MRQQRGVALITVLLVVALVTVVCAALLLRQQLAIRSTGNQLLVRQAQYYAEGGELVAKALLRRDLSEGQVDHLAEAWANPRLRFPLDEGGELRLRIEDLSGRFNLNSLSVNGEAGELALLRLRRLLQGLQLSPAYADRLRDWLDLDQDPSGMAGAEDDQYLLLKPAYRTGPGVIADVSELRLLLGMSEVDYRRLAPSAAGGGGNRLPGAAADHQGALAAEGSAVRRGGAAGRGRRAVPPERRWPVG